MSFSNRKEIAYILKDFGAQEQKPNPKYEQQQAAAQASGHVWQPSDDWHEAPDWNKGWNDDYKKKPASGQGGKGKRSTPPWLKSSWGNSSFSSDAWGAASGQDEEPEPWQTHGWNWGSQRKARGPDYDPEPGAWDHKGVPAALRGTGRFAHDTKNRRVEEDESADSELSDTSQGPMSRR